MGALEQEKLASPDVSGLKKPQDLRRAGDAEDFLFDRRDPVTGGAGGDHLCCLGAVVALEQDDAGWHPVEMLPGEPLRNDIAGEPVIGGNRGQQHPARQLAAGFLDQKIQRPNGARQAHRGDARRSSTVAVSSNIRRCAL